MRRLPPASGCGSRRESAWPDGRSGPSSSFPATAWIRATSPSCWARRPSPSCGRCSMPPAVAFLMLAHGADAAVCVDRFEHYPPSPASAEVLSLLLVDLEGAARLRGEVCFRMPLDPASGLAEPSFRYVCHDYGLSGLRDEADLIISRAALEYANDLSATFADMRAAMRADGIAIHKVDLAGQRCDDDHPLSFLSYPRGLWSVRCSHKNTVNRWRVDYYRRLVVEHDLETVSLEPTALADRRLVDEVRPRLASCFGVVTDRDLSWLGFWRVLRTRIRPA